jgi:hypothetical protein
MGSNPGQLKTLFLSCNRHVDILHYTKNYFPNGLYFPKIYNQTSLYDPVASGTNVDPTTKVCSSAMSVLPIDGN